MLNIGDYSSIRHNGSRFVTLENKIQSRTFIARNH
jgi:hypothetical protein